jgi:CBS domain-containing protein
MSTQVKDLMTRDLVSVSPQATLREVAEVLSVSRIGGAPVVDASARVIGVVSASDLIDFVAASPGVPTETFDDVEWGEIVGPAEDSQDPEASAYFAELWSDAGADVLERFRATAGPEWNTLEEHTADEIMTRALLSVTPEATVEDAARTMLDNGVHRLLVLSDGFLEGVVTARDLLRVLAERSPVGTT